jgi:hypothetical protein
MSLTPDAIRAAIQADPALLASARSPQPDTVEIARWLSAGRTRIGKVSRGWFALWAAETGARAALEDASQDRAHPLRSVALATLDVLRGSADWIDFGLPQHRTMLDAWVTAGAVTRAQADALLVLATHPDPVDEMSVRLALWADDGRLLV